MKFFRLLASVSAVVLLAACGPDVKITPLGSIPGRPNPNVIKVFREGEVVGRPYTEIAKLSINDRGWGLEEQDMRTSIIKEAQKIGAEGILIHKLEIVDPKGLPITATLILPKKSKQIMSGTAIVFTGE